MGRKGKTQKHTAKEIAGKAKAAKERKGAAGGGGAGAAARRNAAASTMIYCQLCKAQQPSVKSMAIHYDSKHPKEDWNAVLPTYEAEKGVIAAKRDAKRNVQTHNIGNIKAKATGNKKKGGSNSTGAEKRAREKKQLAALESSLGGASKKKSAKKKSAKKKNKK